MAVSGIDMSLLNELYEEIDRNPPALEARKVLIQQFMEVGWFDAANGAIQELLNLDPFNNEAILWSEVIADNDKKLTKATTSPKTRKSKKVVLPVQKVEMNKEMEKAKLELKNGYAALRTQAEKLLRETQIIRNLAITSQGASKDEGKGKANWSWFSIPETKKESPSLARFETHITNLTALTDGRMSSVVRIRQPGSARAVAREIESSPSKAVDIAFTDLGSMAQWLRSTKTNLSDDGLRDVLVKRIQTLGTVLPEKMRALATTALMHAEHEIIHRKYLIEETMLGDPVSEIPRPKFWVSEDGYPWDMDELSQAITSNGGIMRNPLSKQMFTPSDIYAIIAHPLGSSLAALSISQANLSRGVRPQTIDEIEKMATILLADMSEDAMESRKCVDAFLGYMATLPAEEQQAIDEMKVPAKDSQTGQGFDTVIGEAVRDAKGNRVCFHKTGDFLKQAVGYLRKS